MVAEYIGRVKRLGDIWQSANPLDEQILDFIEVKIQPPYLVSPDDAVATRLAGLSTDFTRTNLLPVKAKGEKTILCRAEYNPWMNPAMAKVAVEAHRKGGYPLQERIFYEALKKIASRENGLEPEDRSVHVLEGKTDSNGIIRLTPKMADTRFLLGNRAGEYFKRFKHKVIPAYDLDSSDCPEDKCIANYTWFVSPEGGSVLSFRDGDLSSGDRAFGVLRSGAEGGAELPKNSGYSLSEVRQAVGKSVPELCENQKIKGLENLISPIQRIVLSILRAGKIK